MTGGDYLLLMGVGGGFLVVGLALIILGAHEERRYYDFLATRRGDMREFVERQPLHPQPGALKIGGWIAVAIGLALAAAAVFGLVR